MNENLECLKDDNYFDYMILHITGRSSAYYMDKVKRIREDCYNLGVNIIPCKINNIINSPLILYTIGNNSLLESNKLLGVVGTRQPSELGIKYGQYYVEHIVRNGWHTVSGLAIGCDMIVHKSTVKSCGKSIAVLPMGYKNGIAPWILDSGLIVSEYPPYSRIEKYKCIHRNRIITGISNGLFVIESKKGGGSEHSIKYAFQGDIPISYFLGFKDILKYNAVKINSLTEFDLFLENCIN